MTLATIDADGVPFILRRARRDDLPALVELLAADALRANDDSSAIERRGPYEAAFEAIDRDPAHTLVAVEDASGTVVATMSSRSFPGSHAPARHACRSRRCASRATARGHGLGTAMMRWAIDEARSRGAALVQLTSDARREEAHRFYERLGFAPSHVGFKLFL